MSLSFPRALLTSGITGISLDLQRVDYLSPDSSGRINAIAAGQPIWTLSLDAAPALEIDCEAWRAWVDAQRGALNLFYGRHVKRPLPLLHGSGLPAGWDGVCTGWSQSIDGSNCAELTLNGPFSGALKLSPGDMIGFKWSTTRRSLVRAVESATSVTGSITVTVEPPVPAVTPGGAVAYLNAPECLMRLDSKNTQVSAMDASRRSTVKLVAVQDLIP